MNAKQCKICYQKIKKKVGGTELCENCEDNKLKFKNRERKGFKNDPKYLGIPNICFSLTDKDDKRELEYQKDRIKCGFDDSETWSLFSTITDFIIPRLERYEEIIKNIIDDDAKFLKDIQDVLIALKLIQRDNSIRIFTEKEKKMVKKGLKIFTEIFMSLWW